MMIYVGGGGKFGTHTGLLRPYTLYILLNGSKAVKKGSKPKGQGIKMRVCFVATCLETRVDLQLMIYIPVEGTRISDAESS